MTQREEHERYLLETILSDSISSDNPSEKAKEKARKNSPSYFKALEENLLVKYENKKLIISSNGQNITNKHIKFSRVSFSFIFIYCPPLQ